MQASQTLKQLEERKGGYVFLKIDAEVVDRLPGKRSTRLICTIDDRVSFRCGLNHLGDGNYFIIVAGKNLKLLQKDIGDEVTYRIEVDPDQLGVEMPEVLAVFLEQEPEAAATFRQMTDGKKRSLIYGIIKVKDLDHQIYSIRNFLTIESVKLKNS